MNTDSPYNAPEAETPEVKDSDKLRLAGKWLDKITTREKEFEDGWWKAADEAVELYNNGKEGTEAASYKVPYNILYSNTEVLLPSLYSATPKPDVRSRFKGVDVKPIPQVIERFLTVASDPASVGGDSFDASMTDCVLQSLTAGSGFVRLRYYKDAAFPLTFEGGHYRSLIWGKAARWSKVPWIAFVHKMTREDMFSKFEIEEVDQVGFIPDDNCEEHEKNNAVVYELWDKKSRKVLFLSENWAEKLLEESDDPMKLENYFPVPGLLQMTLKPGKMEPSSLYSYYKKQAEELNRVTTRLNKVLEAIKVRGAYSGLLNKDLENLLAGDDMENKLIPAGEAAMLAQSGGLEKHIWFMPIEKLINVAQQLYQARESIKNVIYEITGISDIIRGSSVASETATAQDLKNKWGTVRLRKMQNAVANYARDLFRMSIDCASTVIPAEKWKAITQLPIPLEAEKAEAKQKLEIFIQQQQAQAMQAQQTPPMPGQSPQAPPQPQQPPPELLQVLQSPSFEEVLKKISEDLNRTFLVNIQTSSTIDLDTAQDKSEIQEFMNAMGQLLSGLQPLAAMGPSGMEAGKAILIAVLQRFKFGIDVADIVAKIEPPQQPGPEGPNPAEQEAQKLEAESLQAEHQMKMKKLQLDSQRLEAEHALAMREMEAKTEEIQLRLQAARLRAQQPPARLAQR